MTTAGLSGVVAANVPGYTAGTVARQPGPAATVAFRGHPEHR